MKTKTNKFQSKTTDNLKAQFPYTTGDNYKH